MWPGRPESPRRGGPPAMQSDDLFVRRLRQPARPALTPHTFEPRVSPGPGAPLLRSGSDAGEARPPPTASPRARAHSNEEGGRGATPARLFADPLALLGLPPEGEPPPEFPAVPEPRWFAHYDVQSLLFDWGAGAREPPDTPPTPGPAQASGSDLLLGAPGFLSEVGGEGELGLGGLLPPAAPPWAIPSWKPNSSNRLLAAPPSPGKRGCGGPRHPAPPLPGGPFPASPAFRALLLAKALNGEQAASRARKFHAMATRTRRDYLLELATNEVTTTSLDSASRFGLPSLGGRRRERPRGPGGELQAQGALVWGVRAAPGGEEGAPEVPCLLGVSAETLVLVAPRDGRVVFNCACRDILAWTFSEHQLDLYHGRGEVLTLRVGGAPGEAVGEIVARLQLVSRGCETRELALPRDGQGRLGFEADEGGFVSHVERFTFAETAGLRPGARLLRVCGRPLPRLGPGVAAALLRSAPKVCVTVLLPDESGRPRRSFSELYEMSLQEPGRRGLQGPGPEGEPGAGLRPATLQTLQGLSLRDGSPAPGPPPGLPEERTEFLHSQSEPSPQSSPSDGVPVLPDATPDLLLVATHKAPHPGQAGAGPPDQALPGTSIGQEALEHPAPLPRELSDSFLPRTLSLRNSISKILSEAGSEPLDEEWKSIAEIASTCNSILEALSREGQQLPEARDPREASKAESDPASGSLSEKVSHLESMLKKLQDDLQKEKADKAALQEEVRSLRHNNRRLQAESQSAAARLLRASQQLGTPGP
ncbi:signal-induced proliferation-associated protein 1 [Sarcophilus harrisii]|uniref:signal-induced proliferation-associated protein 1 n=1 Tax=Sarcophilus harrisii TaxID=9305 RepID=UPI001301FBEF|nr:signal-induced proliferation-associated protein 1 [Sarcophilus harrisii]